VFIEQAMFFALGLLVAGLLMLLAAPAFWRRAMRLSMRRLELLAPLTREEAIAERDLLRADFAVRERRLAQEMDAIKATKSQDMLAVGAQAARVADLDTQLKKSQSEGRDLEHRLSDALKTLGEREELLKSTESALHDVTAGAERGIVDLRTLRGDHEELRRQKDAALAQIAAHEETIKGLKKQVSSLGADLAMARDDQAKLGKETKRLGGVDENLRRVTSELETTQSTKSALERAFKEQLETAKQDYAKLEKEAQRLAGVDDDLHRVRRERDDAQAAKSALERDAAEQRAKAEAEARRRSEEIAQLEEALRLARIETHDEAAAHSKTRGEALGLQSALEALSQEARERTEKHVNGDGHLDAGDVAALRAELANLGARMAELASAQTERLRDQASA